MRRMRNGPFTKVMAPKLRRANPPSRFPTAFPGRFGMFWRGIVPENINSLFSEKMWKMHVSIFIYIYISSNAYTYIYIHIYIYGFIYIYIFFFFNV